MRVLTVLTIYLFWTQGTLIVAQDFKGDDAAISKIQALGGTIERDESSPGQPVIGIRFSSGFRFNNNFMHLLRPFSSVRTLDLSGAAITAEAITQLEQFPELRDLSLGGPEFTDQCISSLCKLKRLSRLVLCDTWVTDGGKARLRQANSTLELVDERIICEKIRASIGRGELSVQLRGNQIEAIKLTDFQRCKARENDLVGVDADSSTEDSPARGVTDSSFKELLPLRCVRTLREISLLGCYRLTDASINELHKFHYLEFLQITNCEQITSRGLAGLKAHPGLIVLTLSDLDWLTDQVMDDLSQLSNLTALYLNAPHVTDAGFSKLKSMTQLTLLELTDTSISTAGLQARQDLPRLSWLTLRSCSEITDESTKVIGEFSNLTELELGDVPVTDAGLSELQKLDHLRTLHLIWCPNITAAGFKELPAIPNLTEIHIRNCRVSDEACKDLEEEFAEIQVFN